MRHAELVAGRRATKQWLEAEGHDIQLTRNKEARNERGGVDQWEVTLRPQSFAIIFAKTFPPLAQRMTTMSFNAVDYDRMLGLHDCDIETEDEFDYDGKHYTVRNVNRTEEQTIAQLIAK